ncbi:MAG: hypothetical protein ACI97A_001667 [Planctomycetota bacterium]|jgi:hypothetical protein
MSKFHRILVPAIVLVLGTLAHAQLPGVGTKAPTFSAQSHLGQKIDFPPKGSWAVLAFYPRAGTPG